MEPAAATHPLRNRVTPSGEIIRHPARGLFMGNRGCLHDAEGMLGKARWRSSLWIICRLEFKGRRRQLLVPGRYTELFFFDEAVGLAAGHRPCGECRRDDYRKFIAAWTAGNGSAPADRRALDTALHAARVDPRSRTQVTHFEACEHLPDGSFIRFGERDVPHLVLGDVLIPFVDYAYGVPISRPRTRRVEVLTPAPTIGAIRGGYVARLHETALAAVSRAPRAAIAGGGGSPARSR